MKLLVVGTLLLASLLFGCSSPKAPAGPDPLSGTRTGPWGSSPDRQTEVVLALKWNGTTLQGMVSPSERAVELTKASFNPQTNAINMDLDFPTADGAMDHYSKSGKVDGKTKQGTWTRQDGNGDFNLTKN